jgi:hypothetical protein
LGAKAAVDGVLQGVWSRKSGLEKLRTAFFGLSTQDFELARRSAQEMSPYYLRQQRIGEVYAICNSYES